MNDHPGSVSHIADSVPSARHLSTAGEPNDGDDPSNWARRAVREPNTAVTNRAPILTAVAIAAVLTPELYRTVGDSSSLRLVEQALVIRLAVTRLVRTPPRTTDITSAKWRSDT